MKPLLHQPWPARFVPATFLAIALLVATAASTTNAPSARVPDPDGDLVQQGHFVYGRMCQACHGRWGDGRGELATHMVPRPRNLTGGIFKYHSTPPGKLPTDADLERVIRGGLAGTPMPAFASMTDRDLRAVIAFLKTLSPRWHWATNHAPAMELPSAPEWLSDATRRGAHATTGAPLFATLCAPCHGNDAGGHGPAVAGLEDPWGQPAPPPDLRQPTARSGPEPVDLYRTILAGIDGSPMPGFDATTTEEQRWELVAVILQRRADFATDAK